MVSLLPLRKMSHYKQELVRLYIGILGSFLETQIQITHFAFNLFFTDKPSDDDDKPDMGPSISTGSKSAMVTQTLLCICIYNLADDRFHQTLKY